MTDRALFPRFASSFAIISRSTATATHTSSLANVSIVSAVCKSQRPRESNSPHHCGKNALEKRGLKMLTKLSRSDEIVSQAHHNLQCAVRLFRPIPVVYYCHAKTFGGQTAPESRRDRAAISQSERSGCPQPLADCVAACARQNHEADRRIYRL